MRLDEVAVHRIRSLLMKRAPILDENRSYLYDYRREVAACSTFSVMRNGDTLQRSWLVTYMLARPETRLREAGTADRVALVCGAIEDIDRPECSPRPPPCLPPVFLGICVPTIRAIRGRVKYLTSCDSTMSIAASRILRLRVGIALHGGELGHRLGIANHMGSRTCGGAGACAGATLGLQAPGL